MTLTMIKYVSNWHVKASYCNYDNFIVLLNIPYTEYIIRCGKQFNFWNDYLL